MVNSLFGFPQNNFDPLVGDTLKVFYYSFLIPLPVLIVFKKFKTCKNQKCSVHNSVFIFYNI